MGSLVDKLYQLDCRPLSQEQAAIASEGLQELNKWHQHLGHLNEHQLKEMVQYELATGVKFRRTAKLSF